MRKSQRSCPVSWRRDRNPEGRALAEGGLGNSEGDGTTLWEGDSRGSRAYLGRSFLPYVPPWLQACLGGFQPATGLLWTLSGAVGWGGGSWLLTDSSAGFWSRREEEGCCSQALNLGSLLMLSGGLSNTCLFYRSELALLSSLANLTNASQLQKAIEAKLI